MADILDYCDGLAKISFKPGQVILPENERLGRLYALVTGQVEVIRERTAVTLVDEIEILPLAGGLLLQINEV